MLKKTISLSVLVTLFCTSTLVVFAEDKTGPLRDRNQNRKEVGERIASRPGVMNKIKGMKLAISGGTVTAISGTALTVTKDSKSYTISTDDKTQFRRKFWGKSSLSEISVNDQVNVRGTWQDENKSTVLAQFIRDVSIQKRSGVFFGTVKTKTTGGFTLEAVKRGLLTVTTSADTKFINRKEVTISLNDIKEGDRVRVRGLWDTKNATLTEVKNIKDFSLPPPAAKATPAGSPVLGI